MAVWLFGRNYEPFYKPFYKYYNIIILILLLIVANLQGNILFWGVFDLAAAATVVDIGRHQAEINFGHTAS